MTQLGKLKAAAAARLAEYAEEKVRAAEDDYAEAVASRNTAEKSTAGDKHETGRALMQAEADRCAVRLNAARELRGAFRQTDFSKSCDTVSSGSLVRTDRGLFLISLPFGKIELGAESVYAVSPQSPAGAALIGRCAGDRATFGGQTHTVREIA